MISVQEKYIEREQKIRSKSRKTINQRTSSILSSNKPEDGKDAENNSFCIKSKSSNPNHLNETPQLTNEFNSKIKDLKEDKQNLLDMINSSEKEIDFLNSIIEQFIDVNELIKIKQKSYYDEVEKSWNIPNFLVQQRKTIFPKLQRAQIKEAAQNDMKHRKIVFKPSVSPIGVGFAAENDDEGYRKVNMHIGEMDERPVTSAAKHRPGSILHRNDLHDESRRSPIMVRKRKQ